MDPIHERTLLEDIRRAGAGQDDRLRLRERRTNGAQKRRRDDGVPDEIVLRDNQNGPQTPRNPSIVSRQLRKRSATMRS